MTNISFDADPFYGRSVRLYTRTVTFCEDTCINWQPCSTLGAWEYMSPESIDEMEEEARTYCEGHEHIQCHEGGRLRSFDVHKCSYCDHHTRVRMTLGTSSSSTKLELLGQFVSHWPDQFTLRNEDGSEMCVEFSRWH